MVVWEEQLDGLNPINMMLPWSSLLSFASTGTAALFPCQSLSRESWDPRRRFPNVDKMCLRFTPA
jgi:hypothetical protein